MDSFYIPPDLAFFFAVKIDCVGSLYVNRNKIPPLVKAKKLNKGEQFGQHLGDIRIYLACQEETDHNFQIPHRGDACVCKQMHGSCKAC
jgi:hypothetical protein